VCAGISIFTQQQQQQQQSEPAGGRPHRIQCSIISQSIYLVVRSARGVYKLPQLLLPPHNSEGGQLMETSMAERRRLLEGDYQPPGRRQPGASPPGWCHEEAEAAINVLTGLRLMPEGVQSLVYDSITNDGAMANPFRLSH
jgi:hypothetical protein